MTITNKYPGTCPACCARVSAGAGRAVLSAHGKWSTYCTGHAPGVGSAPAAPTASTVSRSITAERVGRRTYLRGDTLSVRSLLRDGGCHWDADARAWWIGDHSAALALIERAASAPAEAAPKKKITHCVGCGCALDAYQVSHGYRTCSADCRIEQRMGSGWSGRVAGGGWHQGSDD